MKDEVEIYYGSRFGDSRVSIMPAFHKPPGRSGHLIQHVVHMVIGLMVVCMFHFFLMLALESYRGDKSAQLTKGAEIIGAIRPGLLVGKRSDGILVGVAVTNSP